VDEEDHLEMELIFSVPLLPNQLVNYLPLQVSLSSLGKLLKTDKFQGFGFHLGLKTQAILGG
jgi:hypothetical protein